jgi:ribonuclease D
VSTHPLHRHTISKEEIARLPIKTYSGPIHLVDSDAKALSAAHALGGEEVVGFDTETRPAFKKGESYLPSLVQLAGKSGVYLFQLRHIHAPAPLIHILNDKRVLKSGIAVDDDIKNLNKLFPVDPASFVELAEMASKAGIKHAGLRGLAALLFGFRISKQTKCSRWDSPKLDRGQIVYAATDAWICRELYFALGALPRR